MTEPQTDEPDLLATVAEVEDRLGEDFDPAARRMAVGALEDLTVTVRDEGLASWTLATVPPTVRRIVRRAAVRFMRNPENIAQRTIGGDGVTYRDAGDELTDDEVDHVRVKAGKPRKGAVTSVRTPLPDERIGVMRTRGWDDDCVAELLL